MPRNIKIADDIYEYVQSHAIPFEDDFNSALRRLLFSIDPKPTKGDTTKPTSTRLPRGSTTPRKSYYLPVLESLNQLGGRAKTAEILCQVYSNMGAVLTKHDKAVVASGKNFRWKNNTHWCIHQLIKDGHLSRVSTGILEITASGEDHLWAERRRLKDRGV